MLGYFLKVITNNSIMCYFITLCIVSVLFYQQSLPIYIILFGVISVFAFFKWSYVLIKKWHNLSQKTYERHLFGVAFLIRIIYVVFIYYANYNLYGTYYESNVGDILFYVNTSTQFADIILNNDPILENTSIYNFLVSWDLDLSDMGYIYYLIFLYTITFRISDVIIPLLLKSLFGALTCIFISRMAYNHFGKSVGYMTGIFCALQFNMIWWCGSMMKETEMLFLLVYFLSTMDEMILKNKYPTKQFLITLFAGSLLFLFRTVLGAVAFASVLMFLVLGSTKIKDKSKRFLIGGVILSLMVVAGYDMLSDQINEMITASDSSYQKTNMEWRATRMNGNEFAKYAGAAIFAPLILTIPFPSMVYTFQGQEMQMQAHGGYFVKNIMSFFVIFVMFHFIKTKEWKKHIIPIAFTCAYLLALVMSVFAQSGRFHLLVIPFEMMFAAYGITLMNKKRIRWFQYALIFECVVCIAWSWFKLAGRGMI